MKPFGATEMYIIMSIFTTRVYPMGIGITARVEDKCGYISLLCDYCVVTFSVHVEIGFSLYDSYAVVNAFIAWRNFKLKCRPEKERAYRKYGIRQARLDLIQRWCKRCSRPYKLTKPHKNKRMKRVMILCNNQLVESDLKLPIFSWKASWRDTNGGKATASIVERRQVYSTGDACLNWMISFRFVPHPCEIVWKRCMRCGMRYKHFIFGQVCLKNLKKL